MLTFTDAWRGADSRVIAAKGANAVGTAATTTSKNVKQ